MISVVCGLLYSILGVMEFEAKWLYIVFLFIIATSGKKSALS